MHNINTTGWDVFPFEVNGVKYVSKLAPTSPFQRQVKLLPAGIFESMNAAAIRDLVGVNLTQAEIINKLSIVNEHASHAVIELA